MSYYVGYTLICVENFFLFEKGKKYFCTRSEEEYFFIHNNTGVYNVNEFKISKKLLKCFITEEEKRLEYERKISFGRNIIGHRN